MLASRLRARTRLAASIAFLAAAFLALACCLGWKAWASTGMTAGSDHDPGDGYYAQMSVTAPVKVSGELDPATGSIAFTGAQVQNNSAHMDVVADSAAFHVAEGISGNWTAKLGDKAAMLPLDGSGAGLGAEIGRGGSSALSLDTTLSGFAAGMMVDRSLGTLTFTFSEKRETFAAFSADDGSLNFYKRGTKPAVGEVYNGKTVTNVYTGFEESRDQDWDNVCADIRSVTVVDAGIAPISTVGWFYNCKNLASVDLGKLDMSGVREMDYMFSGCSSLESIDLSQVGAGNIASMMSAFSSCTALKSIDLSGLTTTSATDMRGAFSICYELTEITLGQGFVWGAENAKPPSNKTGTKWKADGDGALYSSSDLPSGKADTYRLTEVAPTEPPKPMPKTSFAVFSADDGSLNLYKRMDVPSAGDTFEGKTVTKVFTGFETSYSVKWDSACADIRSVTVVDAGIKPKSTSEWFLNCRSLVSVDLGKLDMSRVREMARMFENCDKLTSIDLSQVGSGNIEMMSNAFNNCTALKSIDLSGLTTSSSTYMTSAFTSCYELTEITLGQGFVWTRGDADLPKDPPGADFGVQWKADSDGALYSPSEIPSGKADTYRRISVDGPSVPDKPDIPSKPNVPDSGGSGSSGAATVEAAVAKDASAWTLDDQQVVAEDISAKGEASLAYARAKAAMDAGTTWSMLLTDGQALEYKIIGISHDDLADGTGKAGLTFLTTSTGIESRMNPADWGAPTVKPETPSEKPEIPNKPAASPANQIAKATSPVEGNNGGGWKQSELRKKMNSGEIWSLMPSDFQNKVKSVTKLTNNASSNFQNESGEVTPTVDRLFLLSYSETVNYIPTGVLLEPNFTPYQWLPQEGTQYEAFKGKVRPSSSNSAILGNGSYWWGRTMYPDSSKSFMGIDSLGNTDRGFEASSPRCVCPVFCL